MTWSVLEHPDFVEEREALPEEVQDKLDAVILLLEQYGPQLGRPHVDTLAGSAHANMKEIRVKGQGVWRFAFAFDTETIGSRPNEEREDGKTDQSVLCECRRPDPGTA